MSEVVERALLIGFGLIIFTGLLGSLFTPFFQTLEMNKEPIDRKKYDSFIEQLDKSITNVKDETFPRVILDMTDLNNDSEIVFGLILSSNQRFSILNVKISIKNSSSMLPINYELKYSFRIFFEGNYSSDFNSIIITKNRIADGVNIIFSEV